MAERYRIALHGFSEFERTTLAFCLKHAAARVPAYEQAERIAESDFIVADASHPPIEGSALRADRLGDTLFIGEAAPPGAAACVARPLVPERILRALDGIVAARHAVGQPGPETIEGAHDTPERGAETIADPGRDPAFEIRFTDLALLDEARGPARHPQPGAEALPVLCDEVAPLQHPPLSSPFAPPPPSPEERRAAKDAARRRSRAARLAQMRRDGAIIEDVLLLDGVAQAATLEMLLEGFGFRVLRATGIAAAIGVFESTPLAAAFLDMAAQGDEGLDGPALCQLVKRGRIALAGDAPPVILLSDARAASEGVRARLAGCDSFLTHPVSRGAVARALEACDVALPAEPRRIPR